MSNNQEPQVTDTERKIMNYEKTRSDNRRWQRER